MSTVKYFSKGNESHYFVDRININFTYYLSTDGVKFGKKSFYFLNKYKVYVKAPNSTSSIMHFRVSYNGNKLLRDYLTDELSYRNKKVLHSNKENYIQAGLLKKAIESGYDYKKLHKLMFKILNKKIISTGKKFGKFMEKELGVQPTVNKKTVSLYSAEINYDVLTPLSIYLADTKEIHHNLATMAQNVRKSQYINEYGDKISFKSFTQEEGDQGTELKGFFSDTSELIIYSKEVSEHGVLNRLERRFSNKDKKLRNKLGRSLIIENDKDLKKILSTLAQETFHGLYPLFNIESKSVKRKRKRILKENCKLHFKHHWEGAYKVLSKGAKEIRTGQSSNCNNAIQTKAKKLHSEGIFIKKARERTATYIVDERWLTQKSVNKSFGSAKKLKK